MIVLGFIAGIFTSIALIPQVYKAFKTKRVNDLSWGLAILYTTGVILWFLYGIAKQDYTIIVSNGVSIFLNSFLIFAKIKYKKWS